MLSLVAYLVDEAKLSIEQACDLIGVSRDVDRRKIYNPNRKPLPWALPPTVVEQIKSVLSRPEYADMSVRQIYYSELAQHRRYCSLRTMNRIAAKIREPDEELHWWKKFRKKPQD